MQVRMLDFFMGMGKDFTFEAMDISQKLFQDKGDVLFNEGDPAGHFYVLLKGSLRLSLGRSGRQVYTAKHPGEIIGWSCLIGRDFYSASAKCEEATELLKFDRQNFLEILQKYPANEALLYKRIAETLGNRLLELYPTII